jgi:hypothetical protein
MDKSILFALRPLIEKGLVALPSTKPAKKHVLPKEVQGKSMSKIVLEGRR